MTKKIRIQILNLAQSIFDDSEYNKILGYLNQNKLVALRYYIEEKTELLSILSEMDNTDASLKVQLNLCNQLEDCVVDAYLVQLI